MSELDFLLELGKIRREVSEEVFSFKVRYRAGSEWREVALRGEARDLAELVSELVLEGAEEIRVEVRRGRGGEEEFKGGVLRE